MSTPHNVFPVHDIGLIDLREVDCGHFTLLVSVHNPLAKEAIFKCSDVSPSEVFGYLLAQLLSVPVPTFQAVCLSEGAHIPGSYVACANHLAILVTKISSTRRIRLEDLAPGDPSLAARILVLCLFDRCEWPELLKTTGGTVLVDLECIGPVMCLDEFATGSAFDIRKSLCCRESEYVDCSQSAIDQTICKAEELSVFLEFKREFSRVAQLGRGALRRNLLIRGHPLSRQLTAFFGSCIAQRQAELAKDWRLPSWPRADWMSTIN